MTEKSDNLDPVQNINVDALDREKLGNVLNDPKPKNLPPVQDVNVDALDRGELETILSNLNGIKNDYPDNSVDRKKIEEQILAITSKIAAMEAESKKNSKRSQAGQEERGTEGNNSLSTGSDPSIDTANFDNLSKSRQELSGIIADGLKKESITNNEDGPDVISISDKTLSFKDKNEFDSTQKAIEGVYKNLEEVGLNLIKVEKSDGENSASFYAIRFPEEYKGEHDVMKITQEEIDEIRSYYEKETLEQKESKDPLNYEITAFGSKDLAMNKESMFEELGLEKPLGENLSEENILREKESWVDKTTKNNSEKNQDKKGGITL